jgi:glutathione S-transferase
MVSQDLTGNPRLHKPNRKAGKVPAMDFGGEIVIESNVISEFVADLFPQAHLRPEGHSADAALKAAKMRQFVEVWQSKVQGPIFAPFFGPGDKDAATKIINGLKNDVVPLLKENGGPYVLGKEFSMAEVLTHSFLLRLFAFAKEGFYGEELYSQLQGLKEVKEWHDAIAARESVKKTWDEADVVGATKKRMEANKK